MILSAQKHAVTLIRRIHYTAPCATRGVAFRCTTSKVTLNSPCFGVSTVRQYAACIARSALMRTQGILGPTLDPAAVTDHDDDETPASGRW